MPVEKKTQSAEMCEKEAIERVKQGDPSGMARLYELHNSRVYSLCLRHTSNAFDADDLTQDIFIQVLRKICTFRGEAQFASWLYKVALNFVRLHARQQRRHGRVFSGEIAEQRLHSVKSRSSNPTQRVALTQALSCLTPVRRMTLLLHDIQGFSHNEVASRMGITVIASKSRLHRAHAAMRNILGSVPAAIRQT
jgi:RNA polymerase sigma-70 factor (ECF subfamily)